MKRALLIALLAVSPLAPTFAASDTGSATSAAEPASRTDAQLDRMQENVKRMLQQVMQMRDAQDPQERRKLMAAHMDAIHTEMQAMHAMQGGARSEMMGGHGAMHGGMMGGGHAGGGAMASGGQDMMAQCMAMMQQHGTPAGQQRQR
jgi:hypothetical protein